MMPASYSQSLPIGEGLNPFDIYFIIPEIKINRYREYISALNEDTSVTGGVFTFKIYGRELIKSDEKGKEVLNLLGNSDIIARIIHPEDNTVHVEHFYIGFDWGTPEQIKNEIKLFLLQVCRANIDEIRQELIFPTVSLKNGVPDEEYVKMLKDFEKLFSKLVLFYTRKTDNSSLRRLRPLTYKTPALHRLPRPANRSRAERPLDCSFLSFEVGNFFSGYEAKKEKKKFLDSIDFRVNEDGALIVDQETMKKILLEGNLMKTNVYKSAIKIEVTDNLNHDNKSKRFPTLQVEWKSLKFEFPLKNKEGTLLFIATMLKNKFNAGLRREEFSSIFKNLTSQKFTRADIYDKIDPQNMPAFEWLKEIYSRIFGSSSFDEWFYNLSVRDWERSASTGINHLSTYISDYLFMKGYDALNDFLNFQKNTLSKRVEYNIDLEPGNITFAGSLASLLPTTEIYINSKPKLSE